MMNDFFKFYEEYIFLIYCVHIVISAVLAFVLSKKLAKRFITTNETVDKKDLERLDENFLRGKVFQFLFKVSLHKNNTKANFVFMFLFNLVLPFVGYFFSMWTTWYLLNVEYPEKIENTNMLNLDEFGISFLKVERIFGEGSMSDLMMNKYAPKSKKLKALASLASNISPVNLQIVRQTLTSKDDEIRMFGYAVINKAEKSLNQKINKQVEIIKKEERRTVYRDEFAIAMASKELANLYWEMVYTELSHESLKDNFLDLVITHIKRAKEYFVLKIQEDKETKVFEEHGYKLQEVYKICSSLYLLMGRVHMQKECYEQAKAEFTIAQELAPQESSAIYPYLAEVYYLTGKYEIVKSILNQADDLVLNGTLYPIVEQWKVS